MIDGPRADALTWLGRFDEAVTCVWSVLERHRAEGYPRATGGIAVCALGAGALADGLVRESDRERRRAEACELGDVARDIAEHGPTRMRNMGPEGLAWLRRVEAEVTRLDARPDPAAWRAAVAAFEGFGHRYEAARCHHRLADALLTGASDGEQGRREAAGLIRSARQVAVSLGARPLRDALDTLAVRYRLDVGSGPAERRVLTPREEEVLRLVAEGLTNREIGGRLFISEKTASVHVSNVIAKLGASGRTEAVTLAHRRGLLTLRPGGSVAAP
jgi:DNA-binding CsgD family transcriptional regulator